GVESFGDLLDHRVRLGVDSGAVEWVLPISDAEEPSSLLERLSANARDLIELGARNEPSVLVSISHNVERGALGDTGDVAEEGPRGGVNVDSYPVYATFNNSF